MENPGDSSKDSSATSVESSKKSTSTPLVMASDSYEDDFDSILQEIFEMEQDISSELQSAASKSEKEATPSSNMEGPSQQDLLITSENEKGIVSNDEFVQFMQNLQQSTYLVADVSKTITTYHPELIKAEPVAPKDESTPSRSGQSLAVSTETLESSSSTTSVDNIMDVLDQFESQLTQQVKEELSVERKENYKIKEALQKMKEATISSRIIKCYSVDGCTRMIGLQELMTAFDMCIVLAGRFFQQPGPHWTVTERLTDLHLERVLEDHENILQVVFRWKTINDNHFLFKNNPDKYLLFRDPQLLLPRNTHCAFDPTKKKQVLKVLFEQNQLPPLDGYLLYCEKPKGSWQKHRFVLRSSGMYYSKKSGTSTSVKDIVRLVQWCDMGCYTGNDYQKFYKAPGPYCFSLLAHPSLPKADRRLIHFCASTNSERLQWMTGIRLAKHGATLLRDYEHSSFEFPWLQLEDDKYSKNGPATVSGPKKRSVATLPNRKTPSSQTKMSSPAPKSPRTRLLANAFASSWKDGTLAAEMKEGEKWPVFENTKGSTKSLPRTPKLDYESSSNMFTLK